jgi:hypothetical protein
MEKSQKLIAILNTDNEDNIAWIIEGWLEST